MTRPHNPLSERVLVLAPHGRDGELARALLTDAGFGAVVVPDLAGLVRGLSETAGAVVLAEEAARTADLAPLSRWLAQQPAWSDMPFVLLTRQGGTERNPVAARLSEVLGNVSFLERPFHPTTLVSLVASAMRGRRRQYEARARMEDLRASERHYRTLFEAIDAGFCTIEVLFEGEQAVDYRFLEVNPAFEVQSGLTGAVGRRMRDLIPEHEQYWFDIYGRVARTGEPARFEHAAAALGRWLDLYAYRIDDPSLHRVAVLFNDITRRRQAELAVAARETELRLVTDTVPLLVCFIDAALTLRYANAACSEWFGLDAAALVGRPARDLLGAEDFAHRGPHFAAALAGEEVRFELDWPRADGVARVAEIRYRPRRGEAGGVDGFYAFAQDITLRRQAEERLASRAEGLEREVEARTRERDQIWQASTDLLCVSNFDGYFLSLNPAWTATLGWSEAEMKATPFLNLVHPEDREATVAAATGLARGVPQTAFENRYRHRDGSHRWLSWNAVSRDGLIYATVRDVTAAKEQVAALAAAEEAMRQSQKMEAVGQLTGGVAHDFNNLLTIIRSSVDFLRRPDLPEARKARYLDAVSDTVDRAAKLTGQLLAFARRQALKPEVIDVGQRLQAVADMLDTVTGARIQVLTVVPDAPCFVRCDVSQFETALINMAVNARDAMDGAGTLTLRLAGERPMPPIRGHAGSREAFAAIAVEDTGSGIAPDQLSRIFEPFYTTKEVGKGTGLGLSQVFGFAKQSGGDVDVASAMGAGTAFTLYLPQVEAPAEADTALPAPDAAADGAGRRVLVVEDNVEVGRFATQILQDLGYETAWAANAEEALERLGPDGAGFDAVFSDVVMPGMGGVALAEELRRRLPKLPVVLASGYSHVLAEEGTHGFELLHKPYSVDQLSRVLGRVVGGRPAARAGTRG